MNNQGTSYDLDDEKEPSPKDDVNEDGRTSESSSEEEEKQKPDVEKDQGKINPHNDKSSAVGVKEHLWKKFQELKKRKEILSSEKNQPTKRSSYKKAIKGESRKRKSAAQSETKNQLNDWQNLKQYVGQQDHLKGTDLGKYTPKTKLDEKIDKALAMGDVDEAERLSDYSSNREFGTRIAEAFDAKKYTEKKKIEDEIKKQRKRKKLAWGFEAKERWETKGNM